MNVDFFEHDDIIGYSEALTQINFDEMLARLSEIRYASVCLSEEREVIENILLNLLEGGE